jgi:uncharacterized protein (DUF433 family)
MISITAQEEPIRTNTKKECSMLSRPNGNGLLNSLSAPAYSIATASRLVGIHYWSVARYLRGYEYMYFKKAVEHRVQQPPVVEQSRRGSTYASFLDLVDLLYVKEFLKRGFALQHLRHALEEARHYLGSPHFARSEFYTSRNEIVLRLPKDSSLIALMKGGQLTIPAITEKLSDKLDFEDVSEFGFARRWYPWGKRGSIVIDPQIAFGRPTLIGHGAATANIYDFYLGENKKVGPVSDWFDIPVPEIKTAVRFEHSLWM